MDQHCGLHSSSVIRRPHLEKYKRGVIFHLPSSLKRRKKARYGTLFSEAESLLTFSFWPATCEKYCAPEFEDDLVLLNGYNRKRRLAMWENQLKNQIYILNFVSVIWLVCNLWFAVAITNLTNELFILLLLKILKTFDFESTNSNSAKKRRIVLFL